MLYAKSLSRDAERIKRYLSRMDVIDNHNDVLHSGSYVYFPVNISDARIKKLIEKSGTGIVKLDRPANRKPSNYQELLKEKLGVAEMKELTVGFDLFGSIALIDVPSGLEKKEGIIAHAIMMANPRIKTVLAKAGPISGVFRTRKMRFVAGEKNFIALHKENGCMFRFDVRKVFFSGRFAFERTRITQLVSPRERVMVMFAGVGPFAIEIAKAQKKSKVVAIELNRYGYKYMLDNIKLNKTDNVTPVLGDVRTAVNHFKGFADRIIMPMPKSSDTFLDEALLAARKKAIVHIYTFAQVENQFERIKSEIVQHAKANGYKVRFISGRVVRPYSAKEAEVVLDYAIIK